MAGKDCHPCCCLKEAVSVLVNTQGWPALRSVECWCFSWSNMTIKQHRLQFN